MHNDDSPIYYIILIREPKNPHVIPGLININDRAIVQRLIDELDAALGGTVKEIVDIIGVRELHDPMYLED